MLACLVLVQSRLIDHPRTVFAIACVFSPLSWIEQMHLKEYRPICSVLLEQSIMARHLYLPPSQPLPSLSHDLELPQAWSCFVLIYHLSSLVERFQQVHLSSISSCPHRHQPHGVYQYLLTCFLNLQARFKRFTILV